MKPLLLSMILFLTTNIYAAESSDQDNYNDGSGVTISISKGEFYDKSYSGLSIGTEIGERGGFNAYARAGIIEAGGDIPKDPGEGNSDQGFSDTETTITLAAGIAKCFWGGGALELCVGLEFEPFINGKENVYLSQEDEDSEDVSGLRAVVRTYIGKKDRLIFIEVQGNEDEVIVRTGLHL